MIQFLTVYYSLYDLASGERNSRAGDNREMRTIRPELGSRLLMTHFCA